METLMTVVPVCIIFFVILGKARKAYKGGLFFALAQLVLAAASAVVSFLLTRLLLNPAKVDFLDLGQKLVQRVPASLFIINPDWKALVKAFPTAVAALIVFSVVFDILHHWSSRVLKKLNKRHKFGERFLNFSGSRATGALVGAVTAVLCIVIELSFLNGLAGFGGHMLHLAEKSTGEPTLAVVADALDSYDGSSVKKITDRLGSRSLFLALTTGQRNGIPFSVGRELTELSALFDKVLPVLDSISASNITTSIDDLQKLTDFLSAIPSSGELIADMVSANQEQLAQSDAALVVSTLMGVSQEQFSDYLSSVTPENAEADLKTFRNIATILQENDLLPAPGESIQLDQLEEEALRSQVLEEVLKNAPLAEHFNIEP